MPVAEPPQPAFADISRLLEPRSVAIVGASDQPGNLGGTVVRYLRKFAYPGAIWPVNPGRDSVDGVPCFKRIADLPGPADLAILALNAASIAGAVRECAAAGIRHGVVWAGGFAEVGGDGATRQRELAEVCRATGFRLCGPNCIGVINTTLGMTASFASSLLEVDRLLPGNISMISQSGGLGSITHALSQQAGFGFRYVISSGNEVALSMADFVHALAHDAGTEVIALYLEGVPDAARFLAALQATKRSGKAVVALKGGATLASARAALAHTGALVGEDRVWDAIFREQAVIRVRSQEELLDVATTLSGAPRAKLPRGSGVAAITFGGGMGVMAADQCADSGLATPPLSEATRDTLKDLVPPIASVANPIDLTPDTYNQPKWLALFPRALDAIAADPAIDTLLFQCGAGGHKANEVIDNILGVRERSDKTVVVSWVLPPGPVVARLPPAGLPVFSESARALRAVRQLVDYRAALSRPDAPSPAQAMSFDWSAHVPAPKAGQVIAEDVCHRILAAAGLPIAAGRLARSADAAAESAASVGYPVALKGISAAVTHRAGAGLVALGLDTDVRVRDTYRRLVAHAASLGVTLDGIYVQHMVGGGMELLVSAFRDPQFGVMVSLGAGGNLTELIDDVTVERAPVAEADALAAFDRLRIASHAAKLAGRAERALLAGFVARFSALAAGAPWRRFVIEINPVKWSAGGVTAVDGLIVVEEP